MIQNFETKKEWLKFRRNMIMASDTAAIVGESKFSTPYTVWVEKVHGYQLDDNPILKYGRQIENPIANMFADQTGFEVKNGGDFEVTVSDELDFVAASIDRRVLFDGNWIPMEIKNIGDPGVKPADFASDPENTVFHYYLQLQHQIYCDNSDKGILCALFPGYNLKWVVVERNEALLIALKNKWVGFHKLMGDPNTPPLITSEKEVEPAKWRHGHILNAESTCHFDLRQQGWVEKKKELSKLKNDVDKEIKILDAQIIDALDGSERAILPNGKVVKYKQVNVKERFKKAYSYNRLYL